MAGKTNNKTLFIILLALVGVLVITRLFTSKRNVRTLETELVQIDTSRISEILLYPRAERGEEISFQKQGSGWYVSMKNISGSADPSSLRNSLAALINLKTERLVARSEDKWKEFHVDDSLGTRVIIKEGRKTTLDMVIGRFEYSPPPGGYQGYGQRQFSGSTYVRESSGTEVYAVEGFLSMNFNQEFNTWRNQTILDLVVPKLSKIVFEYPADSGFIAQKSNNGWMIAGLPADSATVAQYLNGISRERSSDFVDDFTPPGSPDYEITFEGENMTPILVRGFIQPRGDVILNSSINPESWFRSEPGGIFNELFKCADDFQMPASATAG